jgi:hypothetical protein
MTHIRSRTFKPKAFTVKAFQVTIYDLSRICPKKYKERWIVVPKVVCNSCSEVRDRTGVIFVRRGRDSAL